MKAVLTYALSIAFLVPCRAQWLPTNGPYAVGVNCSTFTGSELFIGTQGAGVYESTDNGMTWTARNAGLGSAYVLGLAYKNPYLFASTSNGMFRSADLGDNWTEINNGTSTLDAPCVVVSGSMVFCAYGNMVYSTANDGDLWTPTNIAVFAPSTICAMVVNGNDVFVATTYHGVLRTTDQGANWETVNSGLDGLEMLSLAVIGNDLYAGTRYDKVFKSTTNGASWALSSTGLPSGAAVLSFAAKGGVLYAGGNMGVYSSTDGGASWSQATTVVNPAVEEVFVAGDRIFLASWEHDVLYNFREGLFYSDDGLTWTRSNTGIINSYPVTLERYPGGQFAGMDGGLFRSEDQGASWQEVSYGTFGLQKNEIPCVAVQGQHVFAGTGRGEVYFSQDLGTTWAPRNAGLNCDRVNDVLFHDPEVLLATDVGIYRSADLGMSWQLSNAGLTVTDCRTLLACGDTLLAGTFGGGAFRSLDQGQNWTPAGGLSAQHVHKLIAHGSAVLAATAQGIFRSPDSGTTWQQVNTTSAAEICSNGTAAFFRNNAIVRYSTDLGDTWQQLPPVNPGLPLLLTSGPLGVDADNLYFGVQGMGVWKFGLAGVVGLADRPGDRTPSLQVWPTADGHGLQVVFSATSGPVTLGLWTMDGRLLHTSIVRTLPDGRSIWPLTPLPGGAYLLTAQGAHGTQAVRVVMP